MKYKMEITLEGLLSDEECESLSRKIWKEVYESVSKTMMRNNNIQEASFSKFIEVRDSQF